MKRVIAWLLVLVLCLGLFAGCKKNKGDATTPTGDAAVSTADLEAALEYIKTVYRKPSEKTPKDFQRIGIVPVNGTEYEVVWTANVGEEYIKIVKGTDGMVTIDVNEKVEAEVKYVLTATISDALGNSVSHSWNHLIPTAGNMLSIVEDAYKLQPGESMDYEVTLTGKIIAINTPWDAGYKNITVTIVVEGAEDKPIMCYRLKGEGADKLKPNDIITVTGIIKNYNGTIEFDAGCNLDSVIVGEEIKAPTDPKQIIKEAYALAEGGALPYKATLTGVISKINTEYNPGYKNVTVTMIVDGDKDHPIQCYRLAGDGADKIGEGDTITVTGWLVNYKGTVQFNQGCTLDSWKDTGANVPKPEDTFTTTLVPEIVTEPQEGVAYKFFFEQKNYGKNMYLTGEMDGYYYATTYDPAKAVDVYLEEVSGGWRAYFMKDGAKNYLEMAVSGTHKNVIFTTSPSKTLKWNSEIDTITCDLVFEDESKDYYWGTYSYYKTFSASDVARVTGSDADLEANFVAHFATMKETKVTPAEKAFEQLKNDYPVAEGVQSTSDNYDRKNVYDVDGEKVTVVWTDDSNAVAIRENGDGTVTVVVTRGEEDAPYTLTATITDGDKTYTTSWECKIPALPQEGGLPTTDGAEITIKQAIEAGSAMDHNTYTEIKYKVTGEIVDVYQTTYGNMHIKDAEGNELTIYGTYNADGTVRYDALEVKPVAGDTVTIYGILGQYNGTAQIKNGWIVAHTPNTNPDEPDEPGDEIPVLSIPEANELGAAQTSGYTEDYQVTGTIVEIANTTYGNMYIADAAGNKLYIYGLNDAEGVRYDGMEVKPVVGDIITVVSGLGQYNGDPQMKNATLVEHIQVLTIEAANALGASLTADTETKYLVSGTVTEIKNETYGNMYIQDETGATLYIYGTYDADGTNRYDAMETKPAVGDYVSVYGVMSQYNGSPQMKNGWIVEHRVVVTLSDANTIGEAVANNQTTAIKYQVTGTVTEIKNETYGNMYIQDEAGNQFYIYGLYDAIGNLRYDAMEKKPAVGDTVTVYGVLSQYNGAAQMKNGWLLEIASDEPEEISATLSFASSDNRTASSTTQQVWEQNGITFTYDKNTYNNNLAEYNNPIRLYTGTSLTIAYPGMTKIEFTCNSSSYASALLSSLNDTNAVISSEDSKVTIHLTAAADSYVIPSLAGQVRVNSITVYVGEVAVIEDNTPEVTYDTHTYAFSSFTGTSTQYANETHDLGGGISLNIVKCHIHSSGELRMYSSSTNNGIAIISSEKAIKSIKFNAGNNNDVVNVYASADGNDWTLITGVSVTSSYADHLVEMPEGTEYNYLKLDVDGSNQIRFKSFEFTLVPLVQYVYGTDAIYGDVVMNWGERGEDATFLSPNAEEFYTDNGVEYDELAALAGAAETGAVPTSALYAELKELMTDAHENQTSYGETRYLYCYTDCQNSDKAAGISAFYSGDTIGPNWDGQTWNREHCWPKSKTEIGDVNNSDRGECADLMTLRPVVSSNNSQRNNKAYGLSDGFYNPNGESNGAYDLRGDVARIVLYTYVRWGNTEKMWGESGVIESVDILLDWIEADPVDTWELGRNDSVESVTGTRNVFVDYPELAFALFEEEIPNMVTPSGKAAA